jgi:hypothetical protein
MRNLLFQWVEDWRLPPRWMACAFYSGERNRCLYVAFPLNLIIAIVWWIQDRWARYAQAPSWIDQEVERRLENLRRPF